MDDFASAPRPVSARSPCLPCVFTSPKGTSRDAHTSPPSSVVTCSARNVPAVEAARPPPPPYGPLRPAAQSAEVGVSSPCFPHLPVASSRDLVARRSAPPLRSPGLD